MGTTCINYVPKNKRQYFDDMHTFSNEGGSHTVLKSAIAGGNYYAAVERRTQSDLLVFAVVVKINIYQRRTNPEFCYKEMDEGMGPYFHDCPVAVLDLLTPTENKYANEWRKRCRENLVHRANLAKIKRELKIGDTVKLAEPVKFQGGDVVEQVLIVDRRKRYWVGSTGLGRYQIPSRLLKGATIVQANPN
jgi:hypothetical protein